MNSDVRPRHENRRRIAVVGGGIAGLTLAASLNPKRFHVSVYEAQPERVAGAALGLWGSARRALGGIGVEVESTADRQVEFRRVDGGRLARVPGPDVAQVIRRDLLAALECALPESVDRVREEVTRPQTLDADLVIGADGVRSQVRRLVDRRAADRVETRWVALRGVRSGSDGPQAPAHEYWGPGRLFGDAPVGSDQQYWFTAHVSGVGPEPLDPVRVLDDARTRFRHDDARIVEALADTGPEVLATRLWTLKPMRRYVQGRYVVIGDAAHASLPNFARGATDAVLDAVSLAHTLNGEGSLAAWQARRFPVTQAARVGAELTMRAATHSAWAHVLAGDRWLTRRLRGSEQTAVDV